MGKRLVFYAHVSTLAVALAACAIAFAQDKERPKLKNFGSSLNKTKSDSRKPPESKPQSNSKSEDDDIDVVKVETSLVSSDVLVLDAKGNPVAGLTDKDFVISEDGQPQQLGMLSLGDDLKVSRSIVLIIDYSGSQSPYIKTSVAAAKKLVDKLPASDSMAIVTDDVELIQDFTKNKRKLKDKLDYLLGRQPTILYPLPELRFGRSKQYSALMATLNEAFNDADRRRIVIFQTDGDQLGFLRDSPSSVIDVRTPATTADRKAFEEMRKRLEAQRVDFSLDDVCRAAERARATIYTVVPGHQMPGQGIGQLQAALATVSASTGGWTMFLEKPEDADRIYSSIFSDINRRYIVGYYPTNKEHDGKRRKIDITVRDHPDYVVVGRKWYYAPAAVQ